MTLSDEDILEIDINNDPNWSYKQIRTKGQIKRIKIIFNGKEIFGEELTK